VLVHASPEAATGGNFAVVKSGDVIVLDVEKRILQVEVSDEELSKRRNAWRPTHQQYDRGYVSLYQRHVQQAHLGADMDYLRGASGSEVTRDSH
jgi:L-arabonate dehydrase